MQREHLLTKLERSPDKIWDIIVIGAVQQDLALRSMQLPEIDSGAPCLFILYCCECLFN